MQKKITPILLLLILLLAGIGCFIWMKHLFPHLGYSSEVKLTLQIADDNHKELENVIDHYSRHAADSLQLRAAEFLISNMVYHAATDQHFASSKNKPITFNPLQYSTSDDVTAAKDSLGRIYNLDQKTQLDCRIITAAYLIKHIEWSINVWERSPWKNSIDFNSFCQYILPYRAQNEPLSEWQASMTERYSPLLDSLHPQTGIEACKLINNQIKTDFHYDNRWVFGLGARPVSELLGSISGMCDDLTAYGVCAMRSMGIPVTVDFTLWPNMNMGHSWCAVFDENGKAHSFGAGEQQPGEHIAIFGKRKMAKVYRQHFDVQKSSLAYKNQEKEVLPSFFRNYTISDVTNEYVPVADVNYSFTEKTSSKYAYLCIFNFEWKPFAWATLSKEQTCFQNVGKNIVYLPAIYENSQIVPAGDPFILKEDGTLQTIKSDGNTEQPTTIELTGWLGGIGKMKDGEKYTLLYWKGKDWIILDSSVVENQKLVFKNAISGKLYKLQSPSRCFIVEDNQVKWY